VYGLFKSHYWLLIIENKKESNM